MTTLTDTSADPQTHIEPKVAPETESTAVGAAAPTEAKAEEPAEEPQNALTQKFTEEEWKGVKELRAQLPEILKEALPDKDEAAPITLWGVEISPAGPHDARVSVILIKFLRARNLNVKDAREMFVKTLKWRKEFDVEAAVKGEYDEKIFGAAGKVFGKDKEGQPVTYNLYGTSKEAFTDVDRFIKWRVAFMEKSISLLDFENVDKMIQVHDYEGVSFRRTPTEKAAAQQATAIFQDYYPEFLAKKFFVNVPTFLTWIFWAMKPFISAQTFAKLQIVGSGPATIGAALLPYIDAKELPTRYGGEAEGF